MATKHLLVYTFVSCLAWPLASGFLYLFSGETGSFAEYRGANFFTINASNSRDNRGHCHPQKPNSTIKNHKIF